VATVTRGAAGAFVARATQPQIDAYKRRMGWTMPWYTVVGSGFQEACGTKEYFKLQVFLRDGDRVFLAYETAGRGRRGARQRVDVPRPHAARPAGGLGGHAARPPAGAALPVAAQARRLRAVTA
jgi:hypothetical protein